MGICARAPEGPSLACLLTSCLPFLFLCIFSCFYLLVLFYVCENINKRMFKDKIPVGRHISQNTTICDFICVNT